MGVKKSVDLGHKNQDFSKSVNSFYSGPIFRPSLGHKLSSDTSVVSFLLSERISSCSKGSGMTPEHDENLDFSDSCPDTSLSRKFAQGIESTQRMHRWIAFDLRKDRKLIRSQTNSHILRNLHFGDQNFHVFDTHVDARFPVLCYYTSSRVMGLGYTISFSGSLYCV